MERQIVAEGIEICKKLVIFTRKFLFKVLSVGAIPNHVAFIMDGNRRFAKKHNLAEVAAYRAGFVALMSMLKYCSELNIKYVTIYAFGIDNFNRRPNEVQYLMDLMLEKMEMLLQERSFVTGYGIRISFKGNLGLLSEPIRVAAEKIMRATGENTKIMIQICVAYSSTDEIIQAVEKSCIVKMKNKIQSPGFEPCNDIIKVGEIEKHMYIGSVPDPDIIIRSSGEKRLSNFLLWQTSKCMLYAPAAFWPEIGLRHLVWAVLNFQRHHGYLEKKKKKQL